VYTYDLDKFLTLRAHNACTQLAVLACAGTFFTPEDMRCAQATLVVTDPGHGEQTSQSTRARMHARAHASECMRVLTRARAHSRVRVRVRVF
jgi:hypothetical protein